MNFNKNIKSDALTALKSNWLKTIGISLTCFLIFGISNIIEVGTLAFAHCEHFSIIDLFNNLIFIKLNNMSLSSLPVSELMFILTSFLVGLIYCLINSVLKNGIVDWNYSVISDKNSDFLNIFSYFSSFKKVLLSWYISLQLFLRKIFWTILIFSPSILIFSWSILATVYQNKVNNKVLIPFGYILALCLAIIAFVICLIFLQRYALARYLIISGECNKVRKAIKLSIKIMNGKKAEYLWLICSFIGWFLTCIFVLPLFFVLPYFNISLTLYYRYLIEQFNYNKNLIENNKSIENNNLIEKEQL